MYPKKYIRNASILPNQDDVRIADMNELGEIGAQMLIMEV